MVFFSKTDLSKGEYKPLQAEGFAGEQDLEASSEREQLVGFQNARVKRWAWSTCFTVIAYCLAAITLLLLVISPVHVEISWARRSPTPKFPTTRVLLQASHEYMAPSNEESDDLWNSNVPATKGFMMIDQPEKFDLPPGLPSPNNGTSVYGVTWTHEYHCLKLIRQEFWLLIDGKSPLAGGYDAQPPLDKAAKNKLHHVQHCTDYLRQLIMCRADMTIEWASPEPDSNGVGLHIDGYGVPHTCTKWDSMFDYMLHSQPPRYQKQAEKQLHDIHDHQYGPMHES